MIYWQRKDVIVLVEFDLTAEAENLLKLMYTVYLSRRKEGKGRTQANQFDSAEEIHDTFLKNMRQEDVTALCFELQRNGCISGYAADDSLFDIELSDISIVYGEQKFSRDCKNLLEWMKSIKGILPF